MATIDNGILQSEAAVSMLSLLRLNVPATCRRLNGCDCL
jgi:hypothetical protein